MIFKIIVSTSKELSKSYKGDKEYGILSLDLNIPRQFPKWDADPGGEKYTPTDQDHDDPADYQYASEIFHNLSMVKGRISQNSLPLIAGTTIASADPPLNRAA